MWLQNGFKLHMRLWFVTITNLDENKNEKCTYIIQWIVTYDDI
jgi:hypothetical protein